MEATDLAAVERTRAGDTAAFRVLVERYGRSVFRLAFRMTANEFDAEDVVQETFLRASNSSIRMNRVRVSAHGCTGSRRTIRWI